MSDERHPDRAFDIVLFGATGFTGGLTADYLAAHNADPKPFTWVADADAILDRIKKVCERTSDSGH